MAKNNPYWGKQKGKLGETVLSVVKGQQVQRAYNAEPLNPRSSNQTGQRIRFSNAVKFFTSAIAQQFKFAFEDKRQTESDYNAFMRHNISNGMMITREQYLNKNFPSLGAFVLSTGSIPEIICANGQGQAASAFEFGITLEQAPTTLQQVAYAFKMGRGLLDGDIITIIAIKSTATGIISLPTTTPSWNILQIKVGDESDQRTLASVQLTYDVAARKDALMFTTADSGCRGYSIIISRPTPNGLKVSTARVWYNVATKSILQTSETPAFIKQAKNSWGMGTSAVLEGSLLPNQ